MTMFLNGRVESSAIEENLVRMRMEMLIGPNEVIYPEGGQYIITRPQPEPIFTMGSPAPRSFTRAGHRTITGAFRITSEEWQRYANVIRAGGYALDIIDESRHGKSKIHIDAPDFMMEYTDPGDPYKVDVSYIKIFDAKTPIMERESKEEKDKRMLKKSNKDLAGILLKKGGQ